MDRIEIYTDGSSSPHTQGNAGGWACSLRYKDHYKEICGGRMNATNNQMELTAILKALEAVKTGDAIPVDVYTDSKFCIGAITEWHFKWSQNGWKTSKGKSVLNKGLIVNAIAEASRTGCVFHWVKGHGDSQGNNRVDYLAGMAKTILAPEGRVITQVGEIPDASFEKRRVISDF